MVWKKYLVIIFGVVASGVMWWKVLTTPNIPSPALQGLIFTLVMAFLVWFALGFPRKKKALSADEIGDFLTSSGFFSQSTQDGTVFKKDAVTVEFHTFDRKSDAANYFNQIRLDLTCAGDIAYQSTKSTTSYSKFELETSTNYYCTLLVNSTVITMTSPTESKDDIKQILKTIRY